MIPPLTQKAAVRWLISFNNDDFKIPPTILYILPASKPAFHLILYALNTRKIV